VNLRPFRYLDDLTEASAFSPRLRRIVITVPLNAHRAHRTTLLQLDDAADVPTLEEQASAWPESQRHHLVQARLALIPRERQVCDHQSVVPELGRRRSHGIGPVTPQRVR
jgi:hypothetical protein